MNTYLIALTDGRCTHAVADSDYLARAVSALMFSMDELPGDALVMEVAE